MKAILKLTICVICCTLSAQSLPTTSNDFTNLKLLNYLLLAQNSSNDTQTFTQCFNKYLPLLNSLSNTFSKQYQACLTLSEQQTTKLYSELTANRTALYQDTATICNAFQSCQSIFDAATFFSCLQTASTQSTPKLYSVSSIASHMVLILGNSLQSIEAQREQCKTTTEQTYTIQNTAIYAELDNCLRQSAPAASISNFQTKCENSECPPEPIMQNTRIVCQAANETSIKIKINDGGAEIRNQTGFDCQLFGSRLNSTNDSTSIICNCGNQSHLVVKIRGNGISIQSQSDVGCGCSILGSETENLPPMPTMGTMPALPPMPTIPPMPALPPMPPMPVLPPMPPMPAIPPMPPMPTVFPFN